jgi:hypothetical protein
VNLPVTSVVGTPVNCMIGWESGTIRSKYTSYRPPPLDGGKSITRAMERASLKIETFGPKWHSQRLLLVQGPKKSRFQGLWPLLWICPHQGGGGAVLSVFTSYRSSPPPTPINILADIKIMIGFFCEPKVKTGFLSHSWAGLALSGKEASHYSASHQRNVPVIVVNLVIITVTAVAKSPSLR